MSRTGKAARAALVFAALGAGLPALAQPPAPATGLRYALEARLDPERRLVDAEAKITWRNTSRAPVHELFFHLYANAFAGEETVFMREGGASIRGGLLERPGGIDLTRLRLSDGTDLLARADTALVPNDATQMRVALPRPVAPGERIELHAAFRVRLPTLLARMGAVGDFFMIAQWFPKLARLEPDGRWVSFPYHGLGEFYADFADYDLVVEVPADYEVAAPGNRVEARRLPDGMRRERYLLRNALDVAWAAHPHLRRVQAQTEGVRIEVFALPGHMGLAHRQAALVREGLARLSARLGPYPYERIVLVLPPRAAKGAAGMEYPGLITGWTTSAATRLNPAADALHALVTAHELAHQWFPILIATNEVERPVLDEGLAEWIGIDLVRERYGRHSPWSALLGVPIDPFELLRAAFASLPAAPSSLLPAHRYRPRQLAPAVYLRPALALETVARTWGRARLWSALGGYARAHRFGHPALPELIRAFDRAYWPRFSGQLLLPALSGVSSDTQLLVVAHEDSPLLRAERDEPRALPLPLRVRLDAAIRGERIRWPAAESSMTVPLAPDRGLLGARVDPHRHNLLDRDASNDVLRLSPAAPRPPLLARVLLLSQMLLGLVGP